jgi:7,8-dihydroneopterin aldolase/epimerase/oxygenase
MATINIHGLRLETIIGFWPEERKTKQRIILHISFEVKDRKVTQQDDVAHGVDYNELVEELIEKVPATSFNLVESLAEFVMDIVMARKKVQYAKVTVEKPDAPVRMIDGISCTLERKRKK